jgi:hypothetical protein
MKQLRIVTLRFSGGRSLTLTAVSRRLPVSFPGTVAGTHAYTHAAKVWDLSIVQGPFSVAPPNLS